MHKAVPYINLQKGAPIECSFFYNNFLFLLGLAELLLVVEPLLDVKEADVCLDQIDGHEEVVV